MFHIQNVYGKSVSFLRRVFSEDVAHLRCTWPVNRRGFLCKKFFFVKELQDDFDEKNRAVTYSMSVLVFVEETFWSKGPNSNVSNGFHS